MNLEEEKEKYEWRYKTQDGDLNLYENPDNMTDILDDIVINKFKKLKNLFEEGLISKEEYEKRKSDLLDLL